jgi:hypothetical protein
MKKAVEKAVLVVTRDDHFRHQLSSMLERSGHRVLKAYSGYSAEYAMMHHPVEVIVMDGKVLVWDPKDRPRTMLDRFPGVRMLVTNASVLSGQTKNLVFRHGGKILDGSNADVIRDSIEEFLQVEEDQSSGRSEGVGGRATAGDRSTEGRSFMPSRP